jgi:penicillin-binding protein 2
MTLRHNSTGKDLRNRYLFLGLAFMLGLTALCVRLYRLQITHGDEYQQKSEANYIKEVRVRADRGMIKDARGNILARNRPSFDLSITPAFCDACDRDVIPQLSSYLGWDLATEQRASQLVKAGKRAAPFQPVPIHLDLSRDELDTLDAHRAEISWAVDWRPVPHRDYPAGGVLSHLLGYMSEINQDELDEKNQKPDGQPYYLGDFIGRSGVERTFEPALRGDDGSFEEVVNAKGETDHELSKALATRTVAPKSGRNVILSIDMRLEEAAEKIFPGQAGAVIVVDVKTGFLKAILSRPGFDPNLLTGRVTHQQMAAMQKDPLKPLLYRPVQERYAPGSTFKAITAFAALKSGLFAAGTSIYCGGGYTLGKRRWRCDNEKGHGPMDLHHALARSCDTYFFRVGDVIGLDAIAEMGRAFGLGSPTGIGLMSEVPGVMPDVAYHDRVTPGGYQKGYALNSAIGQGDDNVTPLQLAMAYTAIANGGKLFRPQVVTRVESADGKVLEEYRPTLVRDLQLNPDHLRAVREGLTAVVNEPGGTGYGSRLPDIKFAGKTGTAQVVALGKTRLKAAQMGYWQRDNAWFAAFAPADDPEIVVVVLNEHSGFGATGSAPTAAAVVHKYFELKAEDEGRVAASTTPGGDEDAGTPVELTAGDGVTRWR